MKFLIFTVLLFSSFSLLAGDPCSKNRSHCHQSAPWSGNGVLHALSSPVEHANENGGVYFAKGTGASCNAAFSNGLKNLENQYNYLLCGGEVKCGNNGAPFLYGQECKKLGESYVAWVKCDNLFHSDPHSPPQPSSEGVGLILLMSLQKDQARRGK